MTGYISMCDERCCDRISHEKLSANWKSKQKRNNESSEGRAHPVTCIICGKPRRLHGHCRSGTSGRACIHERQIQIREEEKEWESGYWPNKALDTIEWPQRRSILEGKSTAADDDDDDDGDDEVAWVSVPVWDACVCVSGQQISDLQMKQLRCLTNFTIDVILQIAILATRTTRHKDPRPRTWAGIVKLKCFEFIQE